MTANHDNNRRIHVGARRFARALSPLLVAAAALLGSSQAQAQQGWTGGVPFTWSAIRVGMEADTSQLVACRATDPAYPGQHPGKTKAGWNSCSFAYGGFERFTTNYQSLPPSWPTGTAQGGTIFGNDGSTQLSFCRASIGSSLQIGKHLKGVNACSIPYGGSEVWVSSYSVLTEDHFGIEPTAGSWSGTDPNEHFSSQFALIGGYESTGEALYPCIGSYAGGYHPGKTRKGWNSCVISYGGTEQWVPHFSLLAPRFGPTAANPLSYGNVLVAGAESNGSPLGICRGTLGGSLQLGKYLFATGRCHISYGGSEHYLSSGFATLRARR